MMMNFFFLLKPFGTIISKFRTSKVFSISSKDIHLHLAFTFYTLPTYDECLRTLYEALKPLRIVDDDNKNDIIEWNSKRYKYSININHEVIELLQQLYNNTDNVNNAKLLLESLRITNIRIDINRDDADITTATKNITTITNKHELRHILMDAYFLLKYIESSVSNYSKIKESLKYITLAVNGSDSNYTPISCIKDKGIPIIEQYDTNRKQWIMYIFVKDSKDVDVIVDCLFR
jgi:hypothetical protein